MGAAILQNALPQYLWAHPFMSLPLLPCPLWDTQVWNSCRNNRFRPRRKAQEAFMKALLVRFRFTWKPLQFLNFTSWKCQTYSKADAIIVEWPLIQRLGIPFSPLPSGCSAKKIWTFKKTKTKHDDSPLPLIPILWLHSLSCQKSVFSTELVIVVKLGLQIAVGYYF